MKRKVILAIMLLVFVSIIGIAYIKSNSPKAFIKDGVLFALKVNDVYVTDVPTSGNYFVTIDCDNADGRYLYDETASKWKITLDNIRYSTSGIKCSVEYDSDGIVNLIDLVENTDNLVTNGNTGVVHETNVSGYGDYVVDAGYRYEGGEPNNYIWFNDELWRIIGSVPTKINSTGTIENRIKIVRNNSIGGLAVTDGTVTTWTSNTPLYIVLNSHYYGANNTAGANCLGSQASADYLHLSKCYYNETGIKTTSRYNDMIIDVFWETGSGYTDDGYGGVYEDSLSVRTVQGKVGLMSAADYLFATSTSHINYVAEDEAPNFGASNWLYTEGAEWVVNASASDATKFMMTSSLPYLTHQSYLLPAHIRPVVYLNPNVVVVSGDGTIHSPYQIALN